MALELRCLPGLRVLKPGQVIKLEKAEKRVRFQRTCVRLITAVFQGLQLSLLDTNASVLISVSHLRLHHSFYSTT